MIPRALSTVVYVLLLLCLTCRNANSFIPLFASFEASSVFLARADVAKVRAKDHRRYQSESVIDLDLPEPQLRIGHGYDIHRLSAGNKLVIAGVEIPHDKGADAHSDGDAVYHR